MCLEGQTQITRAKRLLVVAGHLERRSKPQILAAIARWAPGADVHILRKPLDVDRFLAAFTTLPR